MEITAVDLSRLLENTLLYSDKKAIRLREIFFYTDSSHLGAYACDDYIAVGDSISVNPSGRDKVAEFALDIATAESFLEWVKKDKKVVHKSTIKVYLGHTYIKASCEDYEGDFKADFIPPAYSAWDLVFEMLSEEQDLMMILDFAVRPDRFAKLARLKADKEAPLVFRGIDFNGKLLLQFKKGLTLTGVTLPIDQEYVSEEFLWRKSDPTEA